MAPIMADLIAEHARHIRAGWLTHTMEIHHELRVKSTELQRMC